jgi:tetratricopeptide (TPR) repeat protein
MNYRIKSDIFLLLLILLTGFVTGNEVPEHDLFRAQQLLKQGRADKALQIYKNILTENPNHTPTLEAYAGISLGYGYVEQARKAYEHLFSLLPDSIEVNVGLIEALRESGENEKAFNLGQKLVQIHPDELKPHLCIAMLYEKNGDNKNALLHYQKATKISPLSTEATLGNGRILFRMGLYNEAITVFQGFLKRFPGYVPAMEELAKCLWLNGKPETAAALFEQILSLPTPNKKAIHRFLFLIYSEQQKETDAKKHLLLSQQNAEKMLPDSKLFLFSVTFFLLLLLFIFFGKKSWRFPLINSAALFLALGLAEIYFHQRSQNIITTKDDEINIPHFYRPDPHLGFRAIANQRSLSYIVHNGMINSAKVYTTDSNGWRHTPSSTDNADSCLLFFGDSFTFGWGVADHETLPHFVGKISEKPQKIFNIALPAYGPHQMLAFLEKPELFPHSCATVFTFFSTISDHVIRAAGIGDNQKGPRYLLKENNELIRNGNYGEEPQKDSSNIEEAYGQKKAGENELKLYLQIIKKSAGIIKKRFGQELIVIFWDNWYPSDLDEKIIAGFKAENIRFYKISDILPDYDTEKSKYIIPVDLHPNPLAYRKTAGYLCRQIPNMCH